MTYSTSTSGNPRFQATDTNGAPLAGGQLFTYAAGTSVLLPTYSDAAGVVPNTNPVILDSLGGAVVRGNANYKFVLKDTASNTLWTMDNVLLYNAQSQFWTRDALTPVYVGASSFTLTGDQTANYVTNRALHLIQNSSAYGYVLSASYSSGTGLTTVNVTGATVDAGLSAVEYGQDTYSDPKAAVTTIPVSATDTTPGYLAAKLLAGTGLTVTKENPAANEDLKFAIDATTTPQKNAAGTYTAQQMPTNYALTSASTIAFDNALCAYASVTLGISATLGDPSNKADGQAGEIVVTGASTYTLGVHTNWKMADGTAVALAPAAGKKTWIWWECNGSYNYITKVTQES